MFLLCSSLPSDSRRHTLRVRFLVAAALLSASLAAHADTLTQTFPLLFSSTDGTYEDFFVSFNTIPFDPATGTLNSVTLSLSGTYTVYQSADIGIEGNIPGIPIYSDEYAAGPGTYDVSLFNTVNDSSDLQSAESSEEGFIDFNGPYITDAEVTAAVTYDYTPVVAPVAATPEPSSFALLGSGLLGVAGVMRKRFA